MSNFYCHPGKAGGSPTPIEFIDNRGSDRREKNHSFS
jgi:hypothetical protein